MWGGGHTSYVIGTLDETNKLKSQNDEWERNKLTGIGIKHLEVYIPLAYLHKNMVHIMISG